MQQQPKLTGARRLRMHRTMVLVTKGEQIRQHTQPGGPGGAGDEMVGDERAVTVDLRPTVRRLAAPAITPDRRPACRVEIG